MGCGNPHEFGIDVDVKVIFIILSKFEIVLRFFYRQIVKYDPNNEEETEGVELPGNEVGEIWVNSFSKAYGYWNGDSIDTARREV